MSINNIYSSKDCSVSSVGAGHPEFTPLERGKSLDEGGSPQVGGGHVQHLVGSKEPSKEAHKKWEEAMLPW
jgi:hypothetical protein